MSWFFGCFSCKCLKSSKRQIKEHQNSSDTVLETSHSRVQEEALECQLLQAKNQKQDVNCSQEYSDGEDICQVVETFHDCVGETLHFSCQTHNGLSNRLNDQVEDERIRTQDYFHSIGPNNPDHDNSPVNFIPECSPVSNENANKGELPMTKHSIAVSLPLAFGINEETLSKQPVVFLNVSQSNDLVADINATQSIEPYALFTSYDDASGTERTNNNFVGGSTPTKQCLQDPELLLTEQYMGKAINEFCISDSTGDDVLVQKSLDRTAYTEESSLTDDMLKEETNLQIHDECNQRIKDELFLTESSMHQLTSESPSKSVEFEDRLTQAGTESSSCMDMSALTSEMLSPSSAHSNISTMSCSTSSSSMSKVETPKSVQSSLSREDKPILAAMSAQCINKPSTQKWWDEKGIPNSTNKYKEDQKVSWHATPFEIRLERALAKQRSTFPKRLFMEL